MENLNVVIPAELVAQQSTLVSKIAEIEQQQNELIAQRAEAEASLSRIQNAIRYLNGEMIPVVKEGTVRRPMSAEARIRISEGLKRSAAAKKAAAVIPQPVETVPVPEPVGAGPTKSEKAVSAKRK